MGVPPVIELDTVDTTIVTYPGGSLCETSTVAAVLPMPAADGDQRLIVITEATPFHPLDPLWPDQPADHGKLRVGSRTFAIYDTVTIAKRGDGPVMIAEEVAVRRGDPGVLFFVGHVVDGAAAIQLGVGSEVILVVNEDRRLRLSAAHTACHLLAYALNERTNGLWRKPIDTDSRGHHDFDAATCVSTKHDLGGSVDQYRLGKSLRKRGFESACFIDGLAATVDDVNRLLAQWIESDATVRIDAAGPRLTDRRQWVCETPGGAAQMPCGGTHVRRLGEIARMTAIASFDAGAGILTIRNNVVVRDEPGLVHLGNTPDG